MPPAKKSPVDSPLRRHVVQAIRLGFANNQMYDESSEPFELVINHAITPPSWVQVLDEGVPVAAAPVLNAANVFGADLSPRASGFAAGVREVI